MTKFVQQVDCTISGAPGFTSPLTHFQGKSVLFATASQN